MTKTKAGKICEWFFKVVEAQRALRKLGCFAENTKDEITLCLGNSNYIQIWQPKQFDSLVEALISMHNADFVGEIREEIDVDNKVVRRWFRYAEFKIIMVSRELYTDMKGDLLNEDQ